MRRIKSAPSNIAEMVNRKKPNSLPVKKSEENTILAIIVPKDEKSIGKKNINIDNQKSIKNIKQLNSNTEKITNILNDLINDTLNLSFEETAFLGIILNLLNNTFRKDKLRDFTGIVIQHCIKYFLMFYIHHFVLNDYIEKHSHINLLEYIN